MHDTSSFGGMYVYNEFFIHFDGKFNICVITLFIDAPSMPKPYQRSATGLHIRIYVSPG